MARDCSKTRITIRCAKESDLEMLYEWRNIPEIVNLSASQKTVSYNEHTNWFRNVLNSDSIQLNIINVDAVPCGLIRYEQYENNLELSIYLLPEHVNKNIGSSALKESLAQDFMKNKSILAKVRKENTPSIKFFEKNHFKRIKSVDHFVYFKYKN